MFFLYIKIIESTKDTVGFFIMIWKYNFAYQMARNKKKMYRLLIRLIKLSYMQTSCAYVHPPTLQKGPIRASKNPGNVYCRYFCLNWAIKRRNVKTMHKSHQSTPPRFPQYFYVFKSHTLLLWKIAIHASIVCVILAARS